MVRYGMHEENLRYGEKPCEEPMSYVSRMPCGCIGMMIVDRASHIRDTAKEVATCIRAGDVVERMTCEAARNLEWHCEKHAEEHAAKEVLARMQGSLFAETDR